MYKTLVSKVSSNIGKESLSQSAFWFSSSFGLSVIKGYVWVCLLIFFISMNAIYSVRVPYIADRKKKKKKKTHGGNRVVILDPGIKMTVGYPDTRCKH